MIPKEPKNPTTDVLTLATRDEEVEAADSNGGDGGGALLGHLALTPLALDSRQRAGFKGCDAIHLSRFSSTDLVQWFGRYHDGRYYGRGPVMRIVRNANA